MLLIGLSCTPYPTYPLPPSPRYLSLSQSHFKNWEGDPRRRGRLCSIWWQGRRDRSGTGATQLTSSPAVPTSWPSKVQVFSSRQTSPQQPAQQNQSTGTPLQIRSTDELQVSTCKNWRIARKGRKIFSEKGEKSPIRQWSLGVVLSRSRHTHLVPVFARLVRLAFTAACKGKTCGVPGWLRCCVG